METRQQFRSFGSYQDVQIHQGAKIKKVEGESMRKFSRMRKCLHLESLRRPRRPCASCVFGAAPRTSCPAGSAEASCADHLYKCLWHNTQNCNIRAARIRVGSWQTINHMTRKWTWTLTGLPTRLCASWIMKLSDWSDWSTQDKPLQMS